MITLQENTTILYFGTYNPVHVGHMIIGQFIYESIQGLPQAIVQEDRSSDY